MTMHNRFPVGTKSLSSTLPFSLSLSQSLCQSQSESMCLFSSPSPSLRNSYIVPILIPSRPYPSSYPSPCYFLRSASALILLRSSFLRPLCDATEDNTCIWNKDKELINVKRWTIDGITVTKYDAPSESEGTVFRIPYFNRFPYLQYFLDGFTRIVPV